MLRTTSALAAAVLGLSLATAVPSTASTAGQPFPAQFSLPAGFQPEGIAIGDAPVAYFGSRADGDLYRVDLRTGKGQTFSQGPGTPSNGLKADNRGRLFVSGGSGGDARIVDARTGRILKSYVLATGGETFVNDVVLTRDAAYFTDSRRAVLYKLELGIDGELPDAPITLPLTGDFHHIPGAINANGITTTPDRAALLIVQSNTGKLFRVDPDTGTSKKVGLGGYQLAGGDGLLREGRRLYVVQNRLNTIAVFDLDKAGTSGEPATTITDARFDVPTTVASFADRLYLPNARFTTPPTATTPYNTVAVDKP
ncbi:superoxide dismutase [Streptomyces flavidovirens]|uniref:SMP-30/gluconolactonase/LRE family protein n=1 Tax=Streptomyces flavidovirens TaxID=67298 RepID=UPI00341A3670